MVPPQVLVLLQSVLELYWSTNDLERRTFIILFEKKVFSFSALFSNSIERIRSAWNDWSLVIHSYSFKSELVQFLTVTFDVLPEQGVSEKNMQQELLLIF